MLEELLIGIASGAAYEGLRRAYFKLIESRVHDQVHHLALLRSLTNDIVFVERLKRLSNTLYQLGCGLDYAFTSLFIPSAEQRNPGYIHSMDYKNVEPLVMIRDLVDLSSYWDQYPDGTTPAWATPLELCDVSRDSLELYHIVTIQPDDKPSIRHYASRYIGNGTPRLIREHSDAVHEAVLWLLTTAEGRANYTALMFSLLSEDSHGRPSIVVSEQYRHLLKQDTPLFANVQNHRALTVIELLPVLSRVLEERVVTNLEIPLSRESDEEKEVYMKLNSLRSVVSAFQLMVYYMLREVGSGEVKLKPGESGQFIRIQ